LFFKVDSVNAAAASYYRLSIANVPTPAEPSSGFSYPVVMIPSTIGGNIIGQRTAPGAMNTSFFNFGVDSNKVFINWAA
jgi:hypothetical protein